MVIVKLTYLYRGIFLDKEEAKDGEWVVWSHTRECNGRFSGAIYWVGDLLYGMYENGNEVIIVYYFRNHEELITHGKTLSQKEHEYKGVVFHLTKVEVFSDE